MLSHRVTALDTGSAERSGTEVTGESLKDEVGPQLGLGERAGAQAGTE